jgi:hypothetical protein
VRPPLQFKFSNTVPTPVSQSFNLTAAESPPVQTGSGDGQLVLSLPAGAIPVPAHQRVVLLTVTPLDPARLGTLPVALYSDGNAYRVTASYQPGGAPIGSAAHPIDMVIETPVPSAALLTSLDGRSWTRLADHHIPSQAAVSATFTRFGYVLAAANVPVVTKPVSGGTSVVIVVVLGLAALVPLAAAVIWRWRRRRA